MTLTQDYESLSQFVALESLSELKSRLNDIKSRMNQVTDAVAQRQSSLSDAIIVSKEFQNSLLEVRIAISRLQQKVSLLEVVYVDRLEHALQSVKVRGCDVRYHSVMKSSVLHQINLHVSILGFTP